MAIRLGDMLVKEGMITMAQLEEALKHQVIFGGKIGTNLVELGYLDEDSIAKFLSKKLGTAYIDHDKLMNIPRETIHLLSKDIVEKYRVIPFSLEKKRLTLIMADPTDFAAIDEISFMTNFSIIPVVTPELSLIFAMDKYYGLKKDLRYIQAPAPESSQGGENAFEKHDEMETPEPATAGKVTDPFMDAIQEIEDNEPELINLDDELEEAEIVGEEERNSIIRQYSIDDVSQSLASAEDRDKIADIIVQYASTGFDRVALFMLKGTNIAGWKAMREGSYIENFERLNISINEPSVLKTVAESKSFYLGPVDKSANNGAIMEAIGGEFPPAALIVPVIMMGKVVTILYVDGGKNALSDSVTNLQRLATKASMAFDILIIKNKMIMI